MSSASALARRVLDATAAAVGLLVLSPLLLLIGALVKVGDGGPVFYRAVRVGLGGRTFRLVKFRTMVVGADRVGPGITAGGDRRVTLVGRWLRRTKLDELPQLLNVLAGDMSLVGPRPEDPRYVALYTPEQRRVLLAKPGMTSAASLLYRHEESLLTGGEWEPVYRHVIMPAKLQIDLDYLSNRTLLSDIIIILKTVAAVLK